MPKAHTDPEPDRYLPLTPVAFEILLAVAEKPRHGYDVLQEIERRTRGRVSPNPGTLYRALDRLRGERLLETEERPDAAGEPRRFFKLSALGARVASAEAARLADQVSAARARHFLKGPGAVG